MPNLDISKLKAIFSALDNEKRRKIIELCTDKKLTVTQLCKQLKLTYSITVEYTSMLQRVNLIIKKRNDDKTVNVKSLVRLNNLGEIQRIN